MDINSVLWTWSIRTRTHTEIFLDGLVLILHFYGTRARTHAKCSARTQVSCASPNPVNYIYWVEIRSTPKHQLNSIIYMGSFDLHIDRAWVCAIIQAWGECLVYGLSNWEIHIYVAIWWNIHTYLGYYVIPFTTKILSTNNVIWCLQAICQQAHL